MIDVRRQPGGLGCGIRRPLPEMAQQLLLIVQKIDAERVARPGKTDRHLGLHGPGMRAHHHHAVRQIHRLGHVVGHVDHGLAGLPPHVREQALHVVAGERVERRERLVHQQHGRIVGERARDGDPLLHPAGQMMRVGLHELFELHQLELLARDLLALGLADPLHLQAEGHVSERRAPREQLGEILEHDAAIHAVAGDGLAADADLAGGRRQKSGDDIEQRRLAAARRADQTEEFRRLDVEAYSLDAGDPPGRRIVDERDLADLDMGHRRFFPERPRLYFGRSS